MRCERTDQIWKSMIVSETGTLLQFLKNCKIHHAALDEKPKVRLLQQTHETTILKTK